MSTVGDRLRAVREKTTLSLREFADLWGEDHTLLHRIETGKRWPPKNKIPKFAKLLGLSEEQLIGLIAVEKAGLNSDLVGREIPPLFIPLNDMEAMAAAAILAYETKIQHSVTYPLAPSLIFRELYGVETRFIDFDREKIPALDGSLLYGCLYPDGHFYKGQEKLILINVGELHGRRLTFPERLISTAHEGGHYVLHCSRKTSPQLLLPLSGNPTFCSKTTYRENGFDAREFQATLFAACLLLPRSELLRSIEFDLKTFQEHARSLCRKFGVTRKFLRFRLKQLGMPIPESTPSISNE